MRKGKRVSTVLLAVACICCNFHPVVAAPEKEQISVQTEESLELRPYLDSNDCESVIQKLGMEKNPFDGTQWEEYLSGGVRLSWYDLNPPNYGWEHTPRLISVSCQKDSSISLDGIRCGMSREEIHEQLKSKNYAPAKFWKESGVQGGYSETYYEIKTEKRWYLEIEYNEKMEAAYWYWNNWPEGDYPEDPFDDVKKTDWYAGVVTHVYNEWIMTGVQFDVFGASQPLARAQFAVMLHRLENSPQMEYFSVFRDVPPGDWYTESVLWANKNNIINGYADGKFGPADYITREQMAVMMYRYAQMKGYSTQAKAELSGYKDEGTVSGFAKEAMQWCVAEEIITGKDNETRLAPMEHAARAECAAIISRFLDKYTEKKPEQEPDYRNVYNPLLDQCAHVYGKYNYYALHDIDKDGVKELLLREGTCEADYVYTVYTIEHGRALCLGRIPGSWSVFYQDEEGGKHPYILKSSGHMNYEVLTRIGVRTYQIRTAVLYEGKVENYYSNPYPIELYNVKDKSGLY